jgi:hypothetical protein
MLLENTKVMSEEVRILSLVRVVLHCSKGSPRSLCLAWSVSLHPNGESYASCGGSGNVFVRSAQPSNFGERLSTLSSGRHKFGMHCSHVCVIPCVLSTSLTYDIRRVRMVDASPCHQRQARSISSIFKQVH